MKNVLCIAKREFIATVMTRAFIIGLFILPVMIAAFALVGPRLFSSRNYQVRGEVAIIDATGRVVPELKEAFDAGRIAARRKEEARRALMNTPLAIQQLAESAGDQQIENALGSIPDLHVLEKQPDADIEREKSWLLEAAGEYPHLALIRIHADAVEPDDDSKEYGSYDLYVPPNFDDRAGSEIQRGLQEAIVNARLQARDLDRAMVDEIIRVPAVRSITVRRDAEHQTVRGFNIMLPAAFGALLFMAVIGAGGQLLTSTVEEKSSRVVEVLLSATSPMELMAGKLLGQMAVSLIGMGLYVAMGVALLASFALFGLIDISLIFYLLIFFVITYLVMGSLMMAVGAAVNDMKEAQGLMMPLTIIFMIPWLLWMPISRDPGSALSVTLSFLPLLNGFGMLLRLASNTPPPTWQVWLSIAVGIASVFAALWFAAKIFRIGLLMYGKPPSFGTLIRWVREA